MKPYVTGLVRSIVRQSALLMSLSFKARGIRGLESLAELDEHFERCMEGNPEVTPGALERMSKAYLKVPKGFDFRGDPHSDAYAQRQADLYAHVAGKGYSTENEATDFDFEKEKNDFFPYNTRSGAFVGGQLMSHGFVLKHLDLRPGARIVEFGAGWGNLTLHLVMMGYRMTAVELNKPSIALMAHRASLHGKTIEFAEQDMGEFAAATTERFDAALFLASFHHAQDHRKLLARLSEIVKEDGMLIFADEPVPPASHPALPYPWGLRLDAPSLYYVRRHGWLELGFQAGYFKASLARNGWRCRTVASEIWGVGDLHIATRRKD